MPCKIPFANHRLSVVCDPVNISEVSSFAKPIERGIQLGNATVYSGGKEKPPMTGSDFVGVVRSVLFSGRAFRQGQSWR